MEIIELKVIRNHITVGKLLTEISFLLLENKIMQRTLFLFFLFISRYV